MRSNLDFVLTACRKKILSIEQFWAESQLILFMAAQNGGQAPIFKLTLYMN